MQLSVQNSGETLLNAHQSVSDFSEVNGRVIAQRQATTPLRSKNLNEWGNLVLLYVRGSGSACKLHSLILILIYCHSTMSNTTDRKRSFEW